MGLGGVGSTPRAPSTSARGPGSRAGTVRGPSGAGSPATVGEASPRPQDHPVGQRQRLVDVVGDQQDRRSVASPQRDHQLVHLDPGQRVERAERLVEQQQVGLLTSARASDTRWAWPPESCRGQAHSLSVRPTSLSVSSASRLRSRRSGPLSRASSTFSRTRRQGSSRGSWKATAVRPLTWTSLGRRRVEVRQAAQQRGLAAAAAAQQDDELAGLDGQVDRAEHVDVAERAVVAA